MKTINTALVFGYFGAILGLEKAYYFWDWQWWIFFIPFCVLMMWREYLYET